MTPGGMKSILKDAARLMHQMSDDEEHMFGARGQDKKCIKQQSALIVKFNLLLQRIRNGYRA